MVPDRDSSLLGTFDMTIDLRVTEAAENVVSSSSGLSSQAVRDVGFVLPSDPGDEVNTVLRNV